MIEEYKKFLKKNANDIFSIFTIGVGVLTFFFLLLGGVVTGSMITRYISNSNEMGVYQENLATFQKCAEKIKDASLVGAYCGEAPTPPILIW
jgi:hypothetical protein